MILPILHMNTRIVLKDVLHENRDLKEYSTIRIGGKACYFAQVRSLMELELLLLFAKDSGFPYLILGNGSNVLFSDSGYSGLVINMLRFEDCEIRQSDTELVVPSGVMLPFLTNYCQEKRIMGFEFAVGIPGTVGGAVCSNASFLNQSISDRLLGLDVFYPEDMMERFVPVEKLKFQYRDWQNRSGIILRAHFKCEQDSQFNIDEKIREAKIYRSKRQSVGFPSLGCIFKNPVNAGVSAGELIEKCGFKGMRKGGALCSPVHANYIVNENKASAIDVLTLIRDIKREVLERFKIQLELEINYES